MDLLHEMNYNYIKAKFFIIFPIYKIYNSYRLHDPLRLSDEEMEKTIKDHLDGLKNSKEKELEKWLVAVDSAIEAKVHINKLSSLI